MTLPRHCPNNFQANSYLARKKWGRSIILQRSGVKKARQVTQNRTAPYIAPLRKYANTLILRIKIVK